MKSTTLILTTLLHLSISEVQAQAKPFAIKGNITEKASGVIYIKYGEDDKTVIDSAIINKGKFLFKGKIEAVTETNVMSVKKPSKTGDFLTVYLSPGNQTLSINANDFSNGVLSGTPVSEEAKQLNTLKGDLLPQFSKVMSEYENANLAVAEASRSTTDTAAINKLKSDMAVTRGEALALHRKLLEKEREFMDKYPKGYVTAHLLKGDLKAPDAQKRFSLLSPEVVNSPVGKAIKKQLDVISSGAIGAVAPGFTSTELRGDKLSLSDYKGKYVLLDFWASWCKPCRAGNPHLLELYSKYKDKGFEIIGVSDDDSTLPAWNKAIEDDKIAVWKHVLRGLKRLPDGGFDRSNSIADQYSVTSLPTKILVDDKGVIIGRYTGEDSAMDAKLAEVFKQI